MVVVNKTKHQDKEMFVSFPKGTVPLESLKLVWVKRSFFCVAYESHDFAAALKSAPEINFPFPV